MNWSRTAGGTGTDALFDAWGDGAGNTYVVGYTQAGGGFDAYVLKYNASGVLQWSQAWDGSNLDVGNSIWGDGAGNLYVTGYTNITGTGHDVMLLKYTDAGALLWAKHYGGTTFEVGLGITGGPGGSIYVAGSVEYNATAGRDLCVFKINPAGTKVWNRTYTDTGEQVGEDIWVDPEGNIFIAGGGYENYVLLKADSAGAQAWKAKSSYANWEALCTGVWVDAAGNIYTTGYRRSSFYGTGYAITRKYNAAGGVVWQHEWQGSAQTFTSYHAGWGLWGDGHGNLYVVGYVQSTFTGDYHLALLKYRMAGVFYWYKFLGSDFVDEKGYGIWGSAVGTLTLAGLRESDAYVLRVEDDDVDEDGLSNPAEESAGTDPYNPDSDADGMADGWEVAYGLNASDGGDKYGDHDADLLLNFYEYGNDTRPDLPDTDGDGLNDIVELLQVSPPTDPTDPDCDDDGVLDGAEVLTHGSNPWSGDSDGDGLADGAEVTAGTSLITSDTDGDGLTDLQEVTELPTSAVLADTDGDGLTDGAEWLTHGTSPTRPDTDSDNVTDYQEIVVYGTNATLADTDGDLLPDYDEIFLYGSNASALDTDGDGLTDYQEIFEYHTNASSIDTDGDGMTDPQEVRDNLDPCDPTDRLGDADQDGLPNYYEYGNGTRVNAADSDGDGLLDGDEVLQYGTNPVLGDTDGDGLADGQELSYQTNPLVPDTDGDGCTDGAEVAAGTDPLDPASNPDARELQRAVSIVVGVICIAGGVVVYVKVGHPRLKRYRQRQAHARQLAINREREELRRLQALKEEKARRRREEQRREAEMEALIEEVPLPEGALYQTMLQVRAGLASDKPEAALEDLTRVGRVASGELLDKDLLAKLPRDRVSFATRCFRVAARFLDLLERTGTAGTGVKPKAGVIPDTGARIDAGAGAEAWIRAGGCEVIQGALDRAGACFVNAPPARGLARACEDLIAGRDIKLDAGDFTTLQEQFPFPGIEEFLVMAWYQQPLHNNALVDLPELDADFKPGRVDLEVNLTLPAYHGKRGITALLVHELAAEHSDNTRLDVPTGVGKLPLGKETPVTIPVVVNTLREKTFVGPLRLRYSTDVHPDVQGWVTIEFEWRPFKGLSLEADERNEYHTYKERSEALSFHPRLDIIEDIVQPGALLGVILVEAKEATIATVQDSSITVLKHLRSGLQGKHGKGGQSQRRFERLFEEGVRNFLKRVAEKANPLFLAREVDGILLGGMAFRKNEFLKLELLHYELQDRVFGIVDTGYNGTSGVREALERAEGILEKLEYVRQRKIFNLFLAELVQETGKAVHGKASVERALSQGIVETLVLSAEVEPELREKLENIAGQFSTRVEVLPADTEWGEALLETFDGIAGVLRY